MLYNIVLQHRYDGVDGQLIQMDPPGLAPERDQGGGAWGFAEKDEGAVDVEKKFGIF